MKKGLVITFTVALLGAVGLYNSKHSAAAKPAAQPPNSVKNTSSQNGQSQTPATASGSRFKDGDYMGRVADTPYGAIQVMVSIGGGKITDVHFIQMPSDRGHSMEVTRDSEPLLLQSTLVKQSADVDFVSGATSTVYGYKESLQSALDKAAGSGFISAGHYSA